MQEAVQPARYARGRPDAKAYIPMAGNHERRSADEWSSHTDVIYLGILTVAIAVTGVAVAIAANSEILPSTSIG